MSNPLYDMLEHMAIQEDIAEIGVILSGYESANGKYEELDIQARKKIEQMQRKDPGVFVATAPKPGSPGIPWSYVPSSQLYNILSGIKTYLEEKLVNKTKKQQGDNNHA